MSVPMGEAALSGQVGLSRIDAPAAINETPQAALQHQPAAAASVQPTTQLDPASKSASLRADEVTRPSFRDAFATPRVTDAERLGDRVLDRLDRIQKRTLQPHTEPGGERVGMLSSATVGSVGTEAAGEAQFDRQMELLQASFNHAIEVELASKTGTSLASSMNKLMSGN